MNHLFEAILVIAFTGGPMNVSPASSKAVANLAFSLRKPYLKKLEYL
jgi:hypothetical protein